MCETALTLAKFSESLFCNEVLWGYETMLLWAAPLSILWLFNTAGFRCVCLSLHGFPCQSRAVTAGSTYDTCGKVCDSLDGAVCFSPVLVMFLLGCGKKHKQGGEGTMEICDLLNFGLKHLLAYAEHCKKKKKK